MNKAKAAAKAAGLKKYHDEENPCPKHPDALRYVRTSHCVECRRERNCSPEYHEKFRTPKYNLRRRKWCRDNPELYLLTSAKRRAKRDGLEFNIYKDDIKIPGRCPYLNEKLVRKGGLHGPNSPSLDRIDNRLGYVKGNVEIISDRANRLKRDATLEELIMMGDRARKLLKQRAKKRRSNKPKTIVI